MKPMRTLRRILTDNKMQISALSRHEVRKTKFLLVLTSDWYLKIISDGRETIVTKKLFNKLNSVTNKAMQSVKHHISKSEIFAFGDISPTLNSKPILLFAKTKTASGFKHLVSNPKF